MSYIDQSLIAGETIVHRARVSWWSQFPLVLLGIVTLVVAVGIVLLAMAWIKVRSTELAITNRRVIAKFGFVKRHTVEINLEPSEGHSLFADCRHGKASELVPAFVDELLGRPR